MLENRRMIFCCDSYGAHRNDYAQFPELIAGKLPDGSCAINISRGSTGFANGANGTHMSVFLERESAFGQLFGDEAFDRNSVTDIFFGCGHNDNASVPADVAAAIAAMSAYIAANYPRATMWIIYASTDQSNSDDDGYEGHAVRQRCFTNVYRPYASAQMAHRNVAFIDASGVFSCRATMMRDRVHPNAYGSLILADYIYSQLTGVQNKRSHRATIRAYSTLTYPDKISISSAVDAGSIRATLLDATFLQFATPVTTTGSAAQVRKIGRITDGDLLWMQQAAVGNQYWPVSFGIARSAGGVYSPVAMRWNVDKAGNLYVMLDPRQAGMQSDGISIIYLSQATITMDCFE